MLICNDILKLDMRTRQKLDLRYFGKNSTIAVGLVLVWRGIWILLDLFDRWAFGGGHIITAIIGIALGFLLLYFPERTLKTLERL